MIIASIVCFVVSVCIGIYGHKRGNIKEGLKYFSVSFLSSLLMLVVVAVNLDYEMTITDTSKVKNNCTHCQVGKYEPFSAVSNKRGYNIKVVYKCNNCGDITYLKVD